MRCIRQLRGVAFVHRPVRGKPLAKSIEAVEFVQTPKALESSKEAQRQLNAGSNLDLGPAISVPILEEYFADSDIYTKENDCLKSSRRPFVSPATPMAQSPLDIRGLHALFMSEFMLQKYGKPRIPAVTLSQHLRGWFIPPWHPLAAGRKSRPSLAISYGKNEAYNGARPAEINEAKPSSLRSRNPFHLACWRLRTARRLRTAFWSGWKHLEGPDGLYILQTQRVPSSAYELTDSIEKFVQFAKTSNLSWAETHRVDLDNLNRQLVSAHFAPVKHYSKAAWD